MRRMRRRKYWFVSTLVIAIVAIATIILSAGRGGIPLPGGDAPQPPSQPSTVGPVGVPAVSDLWIDPGTSWIEWKKTAGGEQAFIRSTHPNARETVLRSGALGKVVVVVKERGGRTVFVKDSGLLSLAPWQQELLARPLQRIEFLPGVKILVQDQWGWRIGTMEDIVVGESFSINERIPTTQGIYALRVSVP